MARASVAAMLVWLLVAAACAHDPSQGPRGGAGARAFEIREDQFWRNGEAVQLISGSLHYFRIYPQHWEDRLLRAKSLGLNAISTYVPWNLHNPRPGVFSFEGGADLHAFLRLANSLNLMVLLRVGPYICAEWDLGGLPSWLLSLDPKVRIRSEDPLFLAQVDAWWDVLLPRVLPHLWANGGPVVLVQVENEYGYYAAEMGEKVNGTAYLSHLVSKARTLLGPHPILYTTDPADAATVARGTLNGSAVFTAIDAPVGADYDAAFALQRQFNPPGLSPPFTAEFYLGWFTNWGEALPKGDVSLAASQLHHILSLNASINFYMAVGGTNFGFTSGANTGADEHDFQPQITSYDYTAPIGEAGDISSPYYPAVRGVIASHLNMTLPNAPALPPRRPFTAFQLTKAAPLFEVLDVLATPVPVLWPKPMEFFGQSSGFILYTAPLPATIPKPPDAISIFGVRDRAHVFITTPAPQAAPLHPSAPGKGPVRRFLGAVERWAPSQKLPLGPAAPRAGDLVQVLVEDMGRVNFGKHMPHERKGVGAVLLDSLPLFNWTVHSLPLTDLSAVPFKPVVPHPAGAIEPAFFKGAFQVPAPADTFLSLKGWSKGVAYVNGFNLGRYWPAKGPQCHLFVPASLLHRGANELILFELDAAPTTLLVSFTNTTDFSCGPIPLVLPANVLVQMALEMDAATPSESKSLWQLNTE